MKYKVIETQTVIHRYEWEVEADDEETATALAYEGHPEDVKEVRSTVINNDCWANCLHSETYTSDRQTTICKGCDEDLGR